MARRDLSLALWELGKGRRDLVVVMSVFFYPSQFCRIRGNGSTAEVIA